MSVKLILKSPFEIECVRAGRWVVTRQGIYVDEFTSKTGASDFVDAERAKDDRSILKRALHHLSGPAITFALRALARYWFSQARGLPKSLTDADVERMHDLAKVPTPAAMPPAPKLTCHKCRAQMTKADAPVNELQGARDCTKCGAKGSVWL